jgi:hypothetical protein
MHRAHFVNGYFVNMQIFLGRHVVFSSYDTSKAISDKGLTDEDTKPYAFILSSFKHPTLTWLFASL